MSENLLQEIEKLREELFTLRMSIKTRQNEKTHLVKQARREIARKLTQLNKAGK